MGIYHDIAESTNYVVTMMHVASGTTVKFPAFLTEFSDSYAVGWSEEMVYGRMDPIKQYQNTTRKISIAFDVLADTPERAVENMNKFTIFTRMMYPVYSDPLAKGGGLGRTLRAPPLLRMSFANLVSNSSDFSSQEGLLGCVDGVSFNPNREAGFYTGENKLIPKIFNISFNFDVQHEHEIGWDTRGEFLTQKFPYNQDRSLESSQNQAAGGDDNVREARIQRTVGGGDQ